jgi:uncharacterized membrane protein
MRCGERSPLLHDQDGALRLITRPTTFEEAIDAALSPIRQAANGHVGVLIRLIEGLAVLAEIASTDRHRTALARHGDMLRRACRRAIAEQCDRGDAERALAKLDAALGAGADRATRPRPVVRPLRSGALLGQWRAGLDGRPRA